MKETNKPFAEALDELLQDRSWSDRELARQIDRLESKAGTVSFATISALHRGHIVPGMRAIELIASALKVKPEHFPEYRLDAKRARLDWRHVGLPKALRELG